MRFWLRQATIIIGSNSYTLDDLAFKFMVKIEDRPKMSTAQVEVYNLSPATRAGLKKGQSLIISAGYKGDVGCIFVGAIADYTVEVGELDNVTKITAADSMEEWLGQSVNKTYKGPIYAKDMLDDLLGIFGVEVAMVQLKDNRCYKRGRVCTGKIKDVITEIACSDCSSRLVIRTGQIIINPPEEGIQTGYLLTPQTGLLKTSKSSETQSTTTTQKAKNKDNREEQNTDDGTIERVCLLNYHIGVADKIVIRDSQTDGTYMVASGTHTGSRDGDWTTTLEVTPV